MDHQLVLISGKGKEVVFRAQLAEHSEFLRGLVIDYQGAPITLYGVSKKSLNLLKDYCEAHQYFLPQPPTKPVRSDNLYDILNDRNTRFFDSMRMKNVDRLLNVADYLVIESLIGVCSAVIASMFKNKHYRYACAEWGLDDSQVSAARRDVTDKYAWINN